MTRLLRVLWFRALRTSQIALSSRFGAVLFTIGKLLRFGFFLLFLLVIISRTKLLAGYKFWEMLLFFVTYNIVDTSAQLLLREVYRFRAKIVSGDFDLFLLQPFSPLISSLFGGVDILDLPMFALFFGLLIFIFPKIGTVSLFSILLYLLLIINSFIIAMAFHILVISLGILTTEVDNAIFLYRDLTQMGRIPVDIYKQPLQGILTFVIPVGIMMTIPAKALLGLLSPTIIIISFMIAFVMLGISLIIWRTALRYYSSASS